MPPTHDVLPSGHDFAAYACTHWPRMVATARLLTDDPGAAEALVCTTLVRTYARWRRVPRHDVDFHVLRCLVQQYLRRRRRGRRTARRRAVLVLRIREGLADAEIAQVLGCSAGAVRAHARHALRAAGADSGTATEQLREAYARAVGDLVPSEAPLDDLQARGRARRRRRIAVASAACAALLAPVVLLGIDRLEGGGTRAGASEAGSEDRAGSATSPVRVVALGERVTIGPGLQVWLTADDGHWSASVAGTGGGVHRPLDEPGVSIRVATVRDGFFLSGLFRGLHSDPSRVEVSTRDVSLTAKVIVLAGSPGWGLWYTSAPLPVKDMNFSIGTGGLSVTVYDTSGKAAAHSNSARGRI
ncbi:sigma factor-like helix-turn-helix DNA-binding protein [Streptomyces sp. NPDC047725]|uniref:sigma factor-like helix-turn-helix DNA-binding protein n=1 Tax=Streptomyces sp. NPDC047725 TaxID=3365487 RepID=UPI003721D14D